MGDWGEEEDSDEPVDKLQLEVRGST